MLKKILTVLVLMVFVVMPLATSAQYPGLKAKDQAFAAVYKNQVQKFNKASEEFAQARNEWIQARDAVRKAKNAQNAQVALAKSQVFLNKAIERMQTHLELLLSWAEYVSLSDDLTESWKDEINDDINALETLQNEVNSADSKEAIIEVSQKIADHFRSTTKPLIRRTIGYVLSVRIEKVLERTKKFGERVSVKIDALPDSPKKTELQNDMQEFNSKISTIENKLDNLRETWSSIDGDNTNNFGRGKTAFITLGSEIKLAHSLLKQMVLNYRNLQGEFPVSESQAVRDASDSEKVKTFSGEGTLTATGDGRAVLKGQADLISISGRGVVSVEDLGGDAEITVTGFGNNKVTIGNREKYSGEGTLTVTGSNVVVKFSGTKLVLSANGEGTAVLSGHGTWNKGGLTGQLTVQGVEVTGLSGGAPG